ncbi:hypothetical protein TanjilG_00425 [Lupinus angustifolius]|uniref:Uncharacterized protein n=1 Tax=Lupinus angustifolius TaxID=3871 RepID=A0A1J7HCB8_LUPAN|nr:PREDICTED: early nodulin-75-like [Lupinus angustifolius]OIW10487.1 hypothetical protein TanjilG_00425 [Lupinus angustifolius]
MSLKYTLVLLLALAFSACIIADEYHHGKLPYGGKGKPPVPHKPPHGKPPAKEEEDNSKVSSISSYHKPPHKKHPPNHKSPTTTTVENNEAAYTGDEYYKPHTPKHGHHHGHPPVEEGNFYKSPKDKPHKPPTAN